MRLLSIITVALAAEAVVASSWFSKAAYNKWNENELERWLSDHNIPYPTPADRKDLENLVKENWENNVARPYQSWDVDQMQQYLTSKGYEVKKGTEKNKDSLISQVKSAWFETEEQASDSYHSVKDWIFDSWTESQLKAFLDKHGIPNPQPRTRDTLLKTVRENFHSVSKKAGQTANYPGNWIYESWSDSDLKAWFDEHGVSVPQPTTRDKLIASMRRNSRLANKKSSAAASSMSASAYAAKESLSDEILDAWSESQLKEFCDKNGIKVPQGSTANELRALARKHKAELMGENYASSASSYVTAATSSAGNQYARATDDAAAKGNYVYAYALQYVDMVKDTFGLWGSGVEASASRASYTASRSAASAASAASASASSATAKAKQEL